VTMRWTRK